MQDPIISIIVAIIGLLFTAFIARLIFSIRAFLNYQEAIIKLLMEIALKNGVEVDKVNKILKQAGLISSYNKISKKIMTSRSAIIDKQASKPLR